MTKFKLGCGNDYTQIKPLGLETDPEFLRKYTVEAQVIEVAKRLFKKYCVDGEGDYIIIAKIENGDWGSVGTIGGHYRDGDGNMKPEFQKAPY